MCSADHAHIGVNRCSASHAFELSFLHDAKKLDKPSVWPLEIGGSPIRSTGSEARLLTAEPAPDIPFRGAVIP